MLSMSGGVRMRWAMIGSDIAQLRAMTRADLAALWERETGGAAWVRWSHSAMVADVLWFRAACVAQRGVN